MAGLWLAFVAGGDNLVERVHATTRTGRRRVPMLNVLQRSGVYRAVGLSLLFVLAVCGTARAQEGQVSGKVTSPTGEPLAGVTVQVRGTTTRTTTDASGKYTLAAPADGVLLYALIGYKGAARTIAGRPTIDVGLEPAVAVLDPVIVTGYQSQRRADITGAVSSANVESMTH